MYHVFLYQSDHEKKVFCCFFGSDRSSSWARRMLRRNTNTNTTELKQIIRPVSIVDIPYSPNHKVAGSIPGNGKYLGKIFEMFKISSNFANIFQITLKFCTKGLASYCLLLFVNMIAHLSAKCISLNVFHIHFASIL